MKNYHSLLPDTDYFNPEYAKKQYPIHLDPDDFLIGVYENKPGEIMFENITGKIWDHIVITNKGLHLFSSMESEKIYFKDIMEVEWSKSKIRYKLLKGGIKGFFTFLQLLYRSGFKRKECFRYISDDLTIGIRLKDNKLINVPILYTFGEYGESKDVAEFVRFLDRVVGDQEKQLQEKNA
jgi:hypothetical protein